MRASERRELRDRFAVAIAPIMVAELSDGVQWNAATQKRKDEATALEIWRLADAMMATRDRRSRP